MVGILQPPSIFLSSIWLKWSQQVYETGRFFCFGAKMCMIREKLEDDSRLHLCHVFAFSQVLDADTWWCYYCIQECITVGCVPPALVTVTRCQYQLGSSNTIPPLDVDPSVGRFRGRNTRPNRKSHQSPMNKQIGTKSLPFRNLAGGKSLQVRKSNHLFGYYCSRSHQTLQEKYATVTHQKLT